MVSHGNTPVSCLSRRLFSQDEGQRKALVAELHKLKTDIFMDMVQRGTMPLRPGVKRLVGARTEHASDTVTWL